MYGRMGKEGFIDDDFSTYLEEEVFAVMFPDVKKFYAWYNKIGE